MTYFLLSLVCAFYGLHAGIGATTLLRPMLDAISPLDPSSIAALCTIATLSAALISAFFALSQPLVLHQDELLLLAVGAVLGGALGDLVSARFFAMLSPAAATLLQNALLFTLVALPAVYFSTLSRTLRPLSVTRMAALPVALLVGLAASFLSFGAEPLTLMVYYLLFDAEHEEAAGASLTITLCAMLGKLIVLLIRTRLNLPSPQALLWLLPGALGGALLAMIPAAQRGTQKTSETVLRLSLFTSLINMAAAVT